MGGRLGDDIEPALSVDPKISKLPRIRTLGIVFVCRVLVEWNAVSGLLASARVRRADSVPFLLHLLLLLLLLLLHLLLLLFLLLSSSCDVKAPPKISTTHNLQKPVQRLLLLITLRVRPEASAAVRARGEKNPKMSEDYSRF